MKILVWLLLLASFPLSAQLRSVFVAPSTVPFTPTQISASVATVTTASTVNLSSYPDWRLFSGPGQTCSDASSFDAKSTGHAISGLHQTGSGNFCTSIGNYARSLGPTRFTTTDGGKAPQTDLSSGLYGSVSGGAKYITVAADDRIQTLQLWVTELEQRTNVVTFHLTDGSAPDSILSTPISLGSDNQAHLLYTVNFSAATRGQFLVVSFANSSFLEQFQAATLNLPALTPNTYYVTSDIDPQDVVEFTKETDTIQLTNGFAWTGSLIMPVNRAVTVRTSVNLAPGLRVKRSEVKAVIYAPTDGRPAISIPEGARNISIDGLEVAPSPAASFLNYGLITVAPNYRPSLAVSDLPRDISLTHMYVHGTPITINGTTPIFSNHTRVGIVADGNRIGIKDSIVSDIAFDGAEANAIALRVSQYATIDNNELASNGENVFLYAAAAYDAATFMQVTAGLYPNQTTISNNWIYKDLKWQFLTYTKNLIEQKNGRNTHIFQNVGEYSFEGVDSQGQHGIGFAIANRVRGGTRVPCIYCDNTSPTPWASTQNIEIDHNILHHVGAAFAVQYPLDPFYCMDVVGGLSGGCTEAALAAVASADGATRATNWSIHDNYVDDIDRGKWATRADSQPFTSNVVAYGIKGPGGDNFHAEHNTLIFAHAPGEVIPPGITYTGIYYPQHVVTGAESFGYHTVCDNSSTTPIPADLWEGGSRENCPHITGFFMDSNVFTNEIGGNGINGIFAFDGLPGNGFLFYTFTNNNVQNVLIDPVPQYAIANAIAPGQYTGNTFNVGPSGTQGVRNLPALLALEAAIKSGNR